MNVQISYIGSTSFVHCDDKRNVICGI